MAAKRRRRRKTGRSTLLTTETHQRIVNFVAAGAYDWVAAEASGISQSTFWEWIRRGEGHQDGRPKTPAYAKFAKDIREARAQSRASAELAVRRDQPFNWLRYGPGRDRPGQPGWTESVNVQGDSNAILRIVVEYEDDPAPSGPPAASRAENGDRRGASV